MSGRSEWSADAEAGLYRIRSIEDATRVATAVLRLAEAGEGDALRHPDDLANVRWLRVPPYAVQVAIDPIDEVVYVLAVYQRGWWE